MYQAAMQIFKKDVRQKVAERGPENSNPLILFGSGSPGLDSKLHFTRTSYALIGNLDKRISWESVSFSQEIHLSNYRQEL